MILRLRAWFFTYKWQLLAVLGAVVGVVLLILRALVLRPGPEHNPGSSSLPQPPQALKDAVNRAHEDALQSRAEAKAKADVQKEALVEVSKIPEAAERRKQLASILRKM